VYTTLLFTHFLAVLLFGGYILLDRLLLRAYFAKLPDKGVAFYKQSRTPMLVCAGVIVVSGGWMVFLNGALLSAPLFVAKVAAGVVLIGLFFYCPVFAKKAGEKSRKAYRFTVLLLLGFLLVVSKTLI
jgi:hypothetical protein